MRQAGRTGNRTDGRKPLRPPSPGMIWIDAKRV